MPDWYSTFYFLPVAAVNSFFELCRRADALGVQTEYLRAGHFVVWRDQEPAEFLLALGFLLLSLRNRLRHGNKAPLSIDRPAGGP